METMNLFNDVAVDDINIDKLYDALAKDDLKQFTEINWLVNMLDKILEYDNNDDIRPIKLYESLYNRFKDLFPYNDVAYHGILTMIDLNTVLSNYKSVVSWSKDYCVAETFAKYNKQGFFITTSVVLQQEIKGFDLNKMLNIIFNYYKGNEEFNFIEKRLKEKEVLGYLDRSSYKVINLNDESTTELK